MKSFFKKMFSNSSKLAICAEWLIQTWALVRGLLILVLVLFSIIKSIDVSKLHPPLIDLLTTITSVSK